VNGKTHVALGLAAAAALGCDPLCLPAAAPLAETPQSISVIDAESLEERGARTLSQAIRLETSVADYYNTVGYPESLQIRGFLLDGVGNYRRDGMAVSSHAPTALENRERIELLRGLSGIQAGTSAPGAAGARSTEVPAASR